MFNKFSLFVVFLILGLVSPIFASSPCNCQTLPSHVGTIVGDLENLVDDVVSDVIEPIGSAVTSLVDNLLSDLLDLDLNNILGGGCTSGCGNNGGLVDGLLGESGVVDEVVSEVEELVDDLLDLDIDLSICVGLDLVQNNLFYQFNSGANNHLVLHGFADISLNVALFTGGSCSDLTCVFVDLDFCGSNNDLSIVIEPFTDYYIGVFGVVDFLIDYDLSCHGTCH